MRLRSHGLPLVIALGLVLLAACADAPPPGSGASVLGATAAEEFGSCAEEGIEFAPPVGYLASVERWLEVTEATPALAEAAATATDENVVVEMAVTAVSPQAANEASAERVALHPSYLAGIEWALRNDSRVFLALGSEGLERELVLYVLVRTSDGEHFFAGDCQNEALTEPVRALLGEATDSTLDRLPGLTGEAVSTLLVDGSGESSHVPIILNPEDAPKDLLESLDIVSFVLDMPEDWTGPYVVVTQIDEGWSDGIALNARGKGPVQLDAYVGASRKVSFWLLDEAGDVADPIQLIGTVDLSNLTDVVEAKGGGVIRIKLTGRFDGPVSEPLRGTAIEVVDHVLWDDVLTDPSLEERVLE